MKKLRIGILGPADIAKRRMLPAILKSDMFEYAGCAVANKEERMIIPYSCEDLIIRKTEESIIKADKLKEEFGGKTYIGYENMLASSEIDAVYIPLPPILHFYWAKKALLNNIHVLLEKPFTTSFKDTKELVEIAKNKNLALFENFAFIYHSQIEKIQDIINAGQIGDLRIIRSNFGFPFRSKNDFRYKKVLGGGALFDCGCYTIKMAQILMGSDISILNSVLITNSEYDVDIYGSVTVINDKNVIAQLSFGMDQNYCCELEIFGNKGFLKSSRIYTAPDNYSVKLIVRTGSDEIIYNIEPMNQFEKSLNNFFNIIKYDSERYRSYYDIIKQSNYIEQCISGEIK